MVLQYNTIANYTATSNGAMPLLYALRDAVPYAFTAVLLIIYFILIGAQYYVIKNRSGRSKILTVLISSSIIMVILSMFLSLAQLVTFVDVVFFAFCAIVFFALYQLSDYW